MTSAPFNNNASKKEREQFVRDSYHTRYQDEAGGRWQKQAPTQVSGKDPATLYPTGPNWSVDPTGPEPPLNQDVNAMEPCGQPWEIEASLNADFGWRKTIQDGVPTPASVRLISASPEPTPDSEVARAEEPVRQPLPLSEGRHSATRDCGRVSPNNLKRRLV